VVAVGIEALQLCLKHSSECLLLVAITFVCFQVNEATTTVFSFAQLIFKFSAAVLATDTAISGTHAARARETKLATMIKDGSVTEKARKRACVRVDILMYKYITTACHLLTEELSGL
jgi:hypothetical protein